MNFIDLIIIVLFVWAGWTGFRKGLVIALFTLFALFLGLYAGIHFSDFATNLLRENMSVSSQYLPVVAFTFTFLAVGAMVYFGGKAFEKVIKVVQLSMINKLLGLFLGILKMVFFIGGFIIITESFDEKNDLMSDDLKDNSLLFYPVKSIVTATIPAFERSTMFVKNTLEIQSEVDEAN